MSYLDEFKKESNINDHKMEDAITEEFISCLKMHIEVQNLWNQFTGIIHGYAGTDHDSYGFDFNEETLTSAPKGNCGFPLNGSDMRHIAATHSLKLKEEYDINYLSKAIEKAVCELGFLRCRVNIYINHHVAFEKIEIRHLFKTEYETRTKIIQPNEFCCIYIEAES